MLTVDAPLVEVFAVLFGYIPLTHIYSVGKFILVRSLSFS